MKKIDKDIKYFSYVKGDTEKMMAAIFGRKNIRHEKATLLGYELCIQTIKDITDKVLPTCPFNVSPRAILLKNRGLEFELYTIRPNPKKDLKGNVWHVTPKEYECLRDYELIDCGMSEDIVAKAITDKGETITINTYGLNKNADKITKVVNIDYRRPEIPTKEKIQNAIRLRKAYIARTT